VSVDQRAFRGSRRSNPATYTGLLDPIRKAFPKTNGVEPALFSANSEGLPPLQRPGQGASNGHPALPRSEASGRIGGRVHATVLDETEAPRGSPRRASMPGRGEPEVPPCRRYEDLNVRSVTARALARLPPRSTDVAVNRLGLLR
jgi:hypothetical protein